MRAALFVVIAAASSAACASTAGQSLAPHGPTDEYKRANLAELEQLEARTIDMLAAIDPRLARRFGASASNEALQALGTAAVLAEDATATVRGGALDLFAFKARATALGRLATELAKANAPQREYPATGSVDASSERELLARIVDEERARVAEESPLGDASAPLVRAMVELWTPGATAADWHDTDAWVSQHLLQIRDSYETPPPRTAASDLEPALFELEKLLVPMQFGKSAFALTQLHAALDKDSRTNPAAMTHEQLATRARVHLGVELVPQMESFLAKAADVIEAALKGELGDATGEAREAVEKKARTFLFAEAKCPPVTGSRARSAAPPPERAAICNVLALAQRTVDRAAALMALHDEVVVAGWTLTPPSPRAHLATLSVRVDDDLADTLKEMAAARPLVPLAAGIVAEALYRDFNPPAAITMIASRWEAYGDAPIDIAKRQVTLAVVMPGSPPPASLHP
jgi:hypothetical protein